MKVKFLGTGTSQGIPVIGCKCNTCLSPNPHDNRLRSSIFIELNDRKILIDTGPDLRSQFLKYGLDDIDYILYTHEHNDHTAGLDDVRPVNFKHEKIIRAFAQQRVVDNLTQRFGYAFDFKYSAAPRISLTAIEEGIDKFYLEDIAVLPIEIKHGTLPILGYRIGNFAYLTDVSEIPKPSLDRLKDLEVVVLSALQKEKHYSHFSLEEAIEIAKVVKAQKTYFIHMSHTMGKVSNWSKDLPPKIQASYDGLEIEI